jgi:SAM-dependent methyltransferase
MSSEWSEPGRVNDYLAREIPYRDIAEQLLLEGLPSHLDTVLDLGTGDGRLLALVRREHPNARGIGLDVSPPMLAHARQRLANDRLVELREHDLGDPLTGLPSLDAVVSALAIHHLTDARKRSLFGEVHELLRPGGVFVNLDLAFSTPELHERFRRAIGREHDDPSDRLAGLSDQLGWLRDAGFERCEVPFKWLELTLFVAVRAPSVKL